MDLLIMIMSALATALVAALLFVHSLLKPEIPCKGKTNVPLVKGIPCLPVLGHAWIFMWRPSVGEFYKTMNRIMVSCVDRASVFWQGTKLVVFVQDPKLSEAVLNSSKSNDKDPDFYGIPHELMGGVFSAKGKRWQELRRPLSKFLSSKVISENYVDVFIEKSEETCRELDKRCDGKDFNIHPHMHRLSVDVTMETLLGVPGTHERHFEYDGSCAARAVDFWFRMLMSRVNKCDWLFHLTGAKKEMDEYLDDIDNISEKLVSSRTALLNKSGLSPEEPLFEPECYTDVVMQVTRNERIDHHRLQLDLLVASSDTSATSASATVLFLAQHPDYQEKAYREQIQIMGNTMRAPTLEEAAKMDYLWMIYQEMLRHVGVPAIARQLTAPLSVDDVELPEGASVFISLHTHKNPKYWERPEEFYPDHFLQEHVQKRPKGAFLPFSTGPRGCPGKTFAIISARILLSMLLRRYKFTTKLGFKDIEWKYLLMVEPKQGYPVQLTRREHNIGNIG